jgi:hypothetical protein
VTESLVLPPYEASVMHPSQPLWSECLKETMATLQSLRAFKFPGGTGCPYESRLVQTPAALEDPLKSAVIRGWLNGELQAPR